MKSTAAAAAAAAMMEWGYDLKARRVRGSNFVSVIFKLALHFDILSVSWHIAPT